MGYQRFGQAKAGFLFVFRQPFGCGWCGHQLDGINGSSATTHLRFALHCSYPSCCCSRLNHLRPPTHTHRSTIEKERRAGARQQERAGGEQPAMSSVDDWLRSELHEVVSTHHVHTAHPHRPILTETGQLTNQQVGYYDKTLAQFILSLGQKAGSASALHTQLLSSGIDEGPRVKPFAEQLFRRLQQSSGGGGGARRGAWLACWFGASCSSDGLRVCMREGISIIHPVHAHATAAPSGASSSQRQPTNAELIRQSKQYAMVDSDDEEFALVLGGGKKKEKVREWNDC